MIGMDIGTTRCKVAAMTPAGKPEIVPNARGEPSTPSVVHFSSSGEVLVGTEAWEQGFLEPARNLRNFKLSLGSIENLLSNGNLVTSTDATEILIRHRKRDAEAHTGQAITEAVATCPANFRDDAKQALLEAFSRNGIKVLKLVPEPTAAGYAYALHNVGRETTIMVYDFGGGTLDVTVLRISGSDVTVLATAGVPRLGGNDINATLRQRVLDQIASQAGRTLGPSSDGLLLLDIDNRVEQAKISLGTRAEVPIVASVGATPVIVKITQDQFHQDIDPLVRQSLEAVDEAISLAGLTIQRIDQVVMVGGTSRMPYVQQALGQHLGLKPRFDIDPEKAVAYGAAIAAVVEMAQQGRTATVRGLTIPAPKVTVRDVTAHAVGCCVVDQSGVNRRLINAVIIPKSTPIPCRQTDTFLLEHDDQAAARIEILQGEPNAPREECLVIGELSLLNLPPEAVRSPRIEVDYDIDANGMVTATATDKVSGQRQTVSVDYKKGIQPEGR